MENEIQQNAPFVQPTVQGTIPPQVPMTPNRKKTSFFIVVLFTLFGVFIGVVATQSFPTSKSSNVQATTIATITPEPQKENQPTGFSGKGFSFATDSSLENPLTLKVSSSENSIVPFSSSLIDNQYIEVYPTFYKGVLYHEFFFISKKDSRFSSIYMERIDWSQLSNLTDEYKGQISQMYENNTQIPIETQIPNNDIYTNSKGVNFYWVTLGGPKAFENPAICLYTDYLNVTSAKIAYKLNICKETTGNTNNEVSLSATQVGAIKKGLEEIAETFSPRR